MHFDSKAIELSDVAIEALSETVVQFHDEIIRAGKVYCPHGGSQDYAEQEGKISSIVHNIYVPHFGTMICQTFFEQCSLLSCRIASSHIFPDGNKRTAFRVLDAQLKKNFPSHLLGNLLNDNQAEDLAIRMAKANTKEKEQKIIQELRMILEN